MALQGITDSDAAYEQAAKKVANDYRNDKSKATADRFDVALVAERVSARANLGGKIYGNNPAELEKIADRLLVEFGKIPEVYYYYAEVARSADMATANRVANKLIEASGVPAEAKAEAQEIKARYDAIGKPLAIRLKATDGTTLDLSEQAGKITILYVWSAYSGNSALQGLLPLKKTLPIGAQIVYLALGGSGEQIKTWESAAALPGRFCLEPMGINSSALAPLMVRHAPYVYVLDRAGRLHGFGPVSDVVALVAAANR